jgi:hypothetical protein
MIKQSWSTSNLKSNAVPAFNQPLWPMLHNKSSSYPLFIFLSPSQIFSDVWTKATTWSLQWSSVQVLLHCLCSLPMFAMLCWCWCLLNCCCIALIFINFFSSFFGTNWYFYFSIMTKIQPCMWHAFCTFTNLTKSITFHGTLVTPEDDLNPFCLSVLYWITPWTLCQKNSSLHHLFTKLFSLVLPNFSPMLSSF